ncbi:MAG: ATPase domain-containing protein [Candidatus Micrarchaeia archaeon]|jgi:KaiC/GvpD/RAD55 family RecA-like ATPase
MDATPQSSVPARVSTGVAGLDTMIGGGLLHRSVTLVGGDSGTGKTTFCLEFLYSGLADFGENSMFISFSEPKEEIYHTAALFGWNFEEFERQGRFIFLHYQPKDLMDIVAQGGGTIRDTIESFNISRVVLDPLTSFSLMFEKDAYREQQTLLELFELLHDLGCTTMVVSEEPARLDNYTSKRADFLSDGIIHFYHLREKGARIRAVEVIKMRDTRISENVCPMTLDENGITVFCDQIVDVTNTVGTSA